MAETIFCGGFTAFIMGSSFFPDTFFFTCFFSGLLTVFFFWVVKTDFLVGPLFFFGGFAVAMEEFLPSEKNGECKTIKVS